MHKILALMIVLAGCGDDTPLVNVGGSEEQVIDTNTPEPGMVVEQPVRLTTRGVGSAPSRDAGVSDAGAKDRPECTHGLGKKLGLYKNGRCD